MCMYFLNDPIKPADNSSHISKAICEQLIVSEKKDGMIMCIENLIFFFTMPHPDDINCSKIIMLRLWQQNMQKKTLSDCNQSGI